jgi:hypothetical protein
MYTQGASPMGVGESTDPCLRLNVADWLLGALRRGRIRLWLRSSELCSQNLFSATLPLGWTAPLASHSEHGYLPVSAAEKRA